MGDTTAELRARIAEAIHREDCGCTGTADDVDGYYGHFADAVLPVVASLVADRDALKAAAWQEGFDAGENMAHLYGHVDRWEEYPANPYEATTSRGDETSE